MQTQAIAALENNPALWKLMNETDRVTLTWKDQEALHKYFELKSGMGTFEFEYYFPSGQRTTISYESMLAQLKKEMFETDARTSTHLIELLTNICSDELEAQLMDESEKYQNRIEEEKSRLTTMTFQKQI